MRTTIIITKRGPGYICSMSPSAKAHQGVRCGLSPFDAAAHAVKHMLALPDACLMAPDEVLAHVPVHLRTI